MSCPQCESSVKGYMRNSCAVWGKWHVWHDLSDNSLSINQLRAVNDLVKNMRMSLTDATEMSKRLYFTDEHDHFEYHLCDLPMHGHWIPAHFTSCNDKGSWTWESRYSWL